MKLTKKVRSPLKRAADTAIEAARVVGRSVRHPPLVRKAARLLRGKRGVELELETTIPPAAKRKPRKK